MAAPRGMPGAHHCIKCCPPHHTFVKARDTATLIKRLLNMARNTYVGSSFTLDAQNKAIQILEKILLTLVTTI